MGLLGLVGQSAEQGAKNAFDMNNGGNKAPSKCHQEVKRWRARAQGRCSAAQIRSSGFP